jgi:hypothetical protein
MKFKDYVESSFNQWKKNGYCNEAQLLNNKVGTDYFDTTNPHFFTGDIYSELVLIHLNPMRNRANWNTNCDYENFQSYWHWFEKFGKMHYGKESERTHKSQFDHKQIRFLKPFDYLSINSNDKYQNLENVIDHKLQLELVPFGSPEFSYHKIGIKNLNQFTEKLLSIINEAPRKYVIFCGRVFEHLLSDYIQDKKTHTFKLKKKDGTQTKSYFQAINVKIGKGDSRIIACIAPQFAKQGYPVIEYGSKIKELYGIF